MSVPAVARCLLPVHRLTTAQAPRIAVRAQLLEARRPAQRRTPIVTLNLEMRGLRGRPPDRLLELDEVERRLKPFGRRYLGVREIPLDALVGTDGRASSFTRDFRPLHPFRRDRLRSLEGSPTAPSRRSSRSSSARRTS
jgi:hypothetical protein